MLTLYYYELMGKITERKGKNYFMTDAYILNKVVDKVTIWHWK